MLGSPPHSKLTYLRHSALAGVEFLVASPSVENWCMFHERYLLCGCTSVATSWVYRRKTHDIEDGTTAFMEPGEIHRVVAKEKPSHFLALFIEPEQFLKLAREGRVTGVPHFRIASVCSSRLLQSLASLSVSLSAGDSALELQSQFAVLTLQALSFCESSVTTFRISGMALKRSLERAREFLEQHVNEPVTLDQLAIASALSRFHLARSFAQQFGLPPHAYQIHLRVKHACRLLRTGMPCVQVASSTGFADQSHFARHFKRIMGVAPSVYASLPKALRSHVP
jgi:AraC-like DNA-binding protein